MAAMQAKYGTPPDIEDKPEWSELQAAQGRLIDDLQQVTRSSPELLFESLQAAMFRILGMDEAVTLTEADAHEIVQMTIEMALAYESRQAQNQGRMN